MTTCLLRIALASSLSLSAVACKKRDADQTAAPASVPPAAPPAEPPLAAAPPAEAPPVATPPAGAADGAKAEALLEARSGSKVTGTVALTARDGKVEVVVTAEGLAPGDHGFHIHEKGDCSSPDAKSAGDHFNPDKVDHGAPESAAHHAGDFGNLTANADGTVSKTITVDFITVDDGPRTAIGKAFVVHENADDFKTQPTGNAGARIACGVVATK